LFTPDPYYQQGGDMVRVGGLRYRCAPNAAAGKRLDNLTLDNGQPLEAQRNYSVAGWATVGSQSTGAPVWDVTANYLRQLDRLGPVAPNQPVLKGVTSNPGIADYG
jgi:sulfur-oxidizing protein SoxB